MALSPSTSFVTFHLLSSTPEITLCPRNNRISCISACGRDNYEGGRLVDEGMIVLRKRIHETKMAERNYQPPENWMAWEKRYFTRYDSFVCALAGALQSRLMDTRPSIALASLALVMLSVPASAAVLALRLMEIGQGFATGLVH